MKTFVVSLVLLIATMVQASPRQVVCAGRDEIRNLNFTGVVIFRSTTGNDTLTLTIGVQFPIKANCIGEKDGMDVHYVCDFGKHGEYTAMVASGSNGKYLMSVSRRYSIAMPTVLMCR